VLKFPGAVTSELTGIICGRQIRHGQETGAFSRISSDILDRFLQSFHHKKRSMCRWWTYTSFSNFSKDFAMATK